MNDDYDITDQSVTIDADGAICIRMQVGQVTINQRIAPTSPGVRYRGNRARTHVAAMARGMTPPETFDLLPFRRGERVS